MVKKKNTDSGNYDADLSAYDATTGDVYFEASPYDATQRYLYKTNINTADSIRVTPFILMGLIIIHFPRMVNMPGISMPTYIVNSMYGLSIYRIIKDLPFASGSIQRSHAAFNLEKFKVTTVDGITMDGIMAAKRF